MNILSLRAAEYGPSPHWHPACYFAWHMTMHRVFAWVTAACSAALFVPLLAPLVAGRVFVTHDLSWFHLPTRYLYQQALRSGDSILWTPAIFSGTYLLGEGQVGLFHPFHFLLYRFLPLQPAFNLELIANYAALFSGMYWFLRRLRIATPASLFGAMLFTFSGFNMLHHQHLNMVAVVAHMPWLLGAADVLIVDERRLARVLAFAGVAVILASELLLGFPQGVWWSLMTLSVFVAYRASETRRWLPVLACGVALAIGMMLAGIQLLPSSDAYAHSSRQWVASDFALRYSMEPFDLIQLWSPYVFRKGTYSASSSSGFHEFGIYSGAVLAVAPIWMWIRRDALRERRMFITTVGVFAAVNLVLALGRYGGLDVILAQLPVLESLRAPVRYIVLVQFALAILAAIAIEDLLAVVEHRRAGPAGRMMPLWIPAILSLVTTVALNTALVPVGPGRLFTAVPAALPGVVFVMAVTVLVVFAARGTSSAVIALVFVTAIDLAAWGIRYIYRQPPQTLEELTQGVPTAPRDPAELYAAAEGPYHSNLSVMNGYRLTSGYLGLVPSSFYPLFGFSARKFTGTRWVISPGGSRYPFEGAVDCARLLDESRYAATGSAHVDVDCPGHLVVEVEAPGRRILALTERFHDGWSATSDGKPLPMVRVEQDFLGCVVDGGTHRVELRFMPRSFVHEFDRLGPGPGPARGRSRRDELRFVTTSLSDDHIMC